MSATPAHAHDEAHAHDKAHDHDHEHADEPEDRRLRVLHGASPFCWWTWGYEGVLNRLKLVYGDQVKVNTYQIPVYEDWNEHVANYGLDQPGAQEEWTREAEQFMGLPIDRGYLAKPAPSCVPGTLMVHAAEAAAPGAGERLARLIEYHVNAEPAGLDLTDDATLLRLAERAGAPRKRVEQALADGTAERSLKEDMQSYHALGLNFYALQARDFEGRTVTIEYAFDAAKIEEAVDWLGRGRLRKRSLPDPAEYVAAHAPVSLREVREVFRLDEPKARKAAERARRVLRRDIAGHTYWVPPAK